MARQYSLTLGGIARCLCIIIPPAFFFTLCALSTEKNLYFELEYDFAASAFVLGWTVYIAYRFYKKRHTRLSPQYNEAFKATFWQHAILLILASLVLDGGLTLYSCILAMIAFWMTTGLIIARRCDSPKQSDIGIIYWGYLLLASSVSCLAWSANTFSYGI